MCQEYHHCVSTQYSDLIAKEFTRLNDVGMGQQMARRVISPTDMQKSDRLLHTEQAGMTLGQAIHAKVLKLKGKITAIGRPRQSNLLRLP